MQFLRENQGKAVTAISRRICDELMADKRVLWLTSGGSNIALEVKIMSAILEKCGDKLTSLAVMPMDERYGAAGHKDSNVQQLREAGFDPGEATLVDVLIHNVSFDQTVSFYTDVSTAAFANAGAIIGQFGMGTDMHVAGIKPDSPACEADAATVVGYEWSDYTRLTLSAEALKQITVAYVPAYGEDKKAALEQLQKNQKSFQKMPAKLLYEIPEVYVYNDSITNGE